ncbi:unnamed protein product [Moneuplotes crassus]|uniref:Uncharacterized protein n=1 Tax=Euplotes crassus TaxID=5936 RepID=A0AAD1UMS2_EUPCR|nr:unnamed protein product [Moneuplotes crassus]
MTKMSNLILTLILSLVFCSITCLGSWTEKRAERSTKETEGDKAGLEAAGRSTSEVKGYGRAQEDYGSVGEWSYWVKECECRRELERQGSEEETYFWTYLDKGEICVLDTASKCTGVDNKQTDGTKYDRTMLKVHSVSRNGKIEIVFPKEKHNKEIKYNISDTSQLFFYYGEDSKIEVSTAQFRNLELNKQKVKTHSYFFWSIMLLLSLCILTGFIIAIVWIFLTLIGFNSRLVMWRVNKFNSEQQKRSVSEKQNYEDESTEAPNDEESNRSEIKVQQGTDLPYSSSQSETNCTSTLKNPGLGLATNIFLSAIKEKAFNKTGNNDLANNEK